MKYFIKLKRNSMKKYLMVAMTTLFFTSPAYSDYIDVVKQELTGSCSIEEIAEIQDKMNTYMAKNGYDYEAEMFQPVEDVDITVAYWVGRSEHFIGYATAYERWFDAASRIGTPEAKFMEALARCRVDVARSGYVTK